MIRVYVRDAGGEAALRRYTDEVEPAVLAVLASQREPHHRSFFHVADDLESVVSNTGTAQFALLLSTLRFLWRFYPVLVPLPDSSDRDRARPGNYRLRYVVEQDSALRRRTFNGDWRQRPSVIFRNAGLLGGLILGVRRNNIAIPLDSAERSQSYHLRCEAPAEDTYLGDQHFEDPHDGSFAQLAGLRGQSYSHLYINGGSAYQGRFMWNWFFEVPPGSAGVAGIAAFASLFGISILAFNQLHWAPQSAWNSATLLLGLPGVVVAFLGVGRSSGFFVGSLRARLSTIVSLAVSLVGLAAAAMHTRSTPHRTTLFVDDLANLPPILIFWSILVILQLLNLLAIGATWMSRTVVYWGVRKIATTGRHATDHRTIDLPRVES